MENFLKNSWTFLGLVIVITLVKTVVPVITKKLNEGLDPLANTRIAEISNKFKLSLVLSSLGALYFGIIFLNTFNIWSLVYFLTLCGFIRVGGKNVAYKTITAIFSNVTNECVGKMNAGSLNWADPIFETVTININGKPNISAELQQVKVEIIETPQMQTMVRGIQCKVKNIVMMLQLYGNIEMLFDIEGGVETIKERINSFVLEIFLDEIGRLRPVDLDTGKGNLLKRLSHRVKDGVNQFCMDNNYPYQITPISTVTIGDTELDAEYYNVLGKKEYSRLEQSAKNLEASELTARLLDTGKKLKPTGTDSEILEAASISLGIIKKDISEKKYGIDSDAGTLVKEILVEILKKSN